MPYGRKGKDMTTPEAARQYEAQHQAQHKHTPGPWAHRNGRIFAADHESLTIANVARSADGDYSPANARLIAAAPELLQSCRGMLHALEKDCRDTDQWAALMGEAVAAIAKATGGEE